MFEAEVVAMRGGTYSVLKNGLYEKWLSIEPEKGYVLCVDYYVDWSQIIAYGVPEYLRDVEKEKEFY